MKWFWEKRYALICLYVIATFVIIYVLKLLLDGAAYFVGVLPAFLDGTGKAIGWIAGIFTPFIMALVIAYLLDPAVDFFQRLYDGAAAERLEGLFKKRKKAKPSSDYKSRSAGTALTYLTVFLVIGILITWLAVRLNLGDDYLAGLTAAVDKTRNQFSETYARFQVQLREMGLLENVKQYVDQIINGVGQFIQSAAQGFINTLSSAGGNILNLLMGLIMAFYLLSGKERVLRGLRELAYLFLPYGLRTGARRVLGDIHSVFSGYIRGQLTDALIMAILVSALLSVIGVDFAVIIGIFTGFSNIIPYFGALIGFLLSVTVALISGEPIKALYAAIGVFTLQQIDGMLINPKVVGKSVELSPLLVILALSAGGAMFGMGGMILAVPVCAIGKMFLTRYIDYRREQVKKRTARNGSASEQGDIMNAGQEKFLDFVLDRVRDDKKDEAKAILDESFAKQDDGSFNAAYLASIVPKLAVTLKPEFVDEVKAVITKFGASNVASEAVSMLAGGALGSLFGGDRK
jgi:predicted PurR-regulated permease PerM